MSYQRLDGDSSDFDFDQISQELKAYNKYINEYQKSTGAARAKLTQQISELKNNLKITFQRARPTKDTRVKLTSLEKQFEDLNRKYKAIPGSEEELKVSVYSQQEVENLEEIGIMERDSLAYVDSVHLKNEELKERKEQVEVLQKDFFTVNEMFKDAALMIKDQGGELDVIENHVTVAASETNKGVGELVKAERYQGSAKKKLCVIMIIAAVVVGVLLAIVFGVGLG